MIRYTLLSVVLLLFSCTKSKEDNDLLTNQSRWDKQTISNYEFTLRVSCFCPREVVGPHVIKVVADTIASVNDQAYDPSTMGYLMTIDELFAFVGKSLDRNPYQKSIAYNSIYGYPESVYFDFEKTMADEEIGYQVTDFKEI
jgi:hypothetical protein